MKKIIDYLADTLEDYADVILSATGCSKFWGEVELPHCLRESFEGNEESE